MRPPKARRIVVAAPLGRYRRLSRGTASNDLPNTLHETRKSRQIAVLTKDPVRSGKFGWCFGLCRRRIAVGPLRPYPSPLLPKITISQCVSSCSRKP